MQQFDSVILKQKISYFDSQTQITFGFRDHVSQGLFLIAWSNLSQPISDYIIYFFSLGQKLDYKHW